MFGKGVSLFAEAGGLTVGAVQVHGSRLVVRADSLDPSPLVSGVALSAKRSFSHCCLSRWACELIAFCPVVSWLRCGVCQVCWEIQGCLGRWSCAGMQWSNDCRKESANAFHCASINCCGLVQCEVVREVCVAEAGGEVRVE